MQRRINISCTVLLSFIVFFAGTATGKLRIEGLSEKQVRTLQAEMPSDSGSALEWLQSRLESLGYFQCSVVVQSSSTGFDLYAMPGPRYRLKSIQFTGNQTFTSQALAFESGLRAGDFFDAGLLHQGINRILHLYGNQGYPFCRASIESIERNDTDLHLSIRVEENGLYFIRNIRFEGNRQTRDSIVLRELDLAPGDTFRQNELDRARDKLRKIDWFEHVGDPRIEAVGRRRWIHVIFPVVEGKGVFAEGMLGYQDAEDRSPWTGALRIDARNLLGTGRRGQLELREDSDYRYLDLSYIEPWIFGRNFQAGINLRMEFEREKSSLLNAGFSLRYPLNDEWSIIGRIERREINEIAMAMFSKSYGGGTGLEWNTLDGVWNPVRGSAAGSDILGFRKQRNTGYSREWRSKIWAETILPLRKRLVGFIHAEACHIENQDNLLLRSEMYRLGGTRSVRGYYEGQFAFESMVWGNLELRVLPEPQSRIYLFLDGGKGFWKEQTPSGLLKQTEWLLGYGAGLRTSTRIGVLGVDLAWGRGTPLRRAKIHAQMRTAL